MNPKKIKEEYQDFKSALGRLKEALDKDVSKEETPVTEEEITS